MSTDAWYTFTVNDKQKINPKEKLLSLSYLGSSTSIKNGGVTQAYLLLVN